MNDRQHSPEYEAALKSDHWRRLRSERLFRSRDRCEYCGRRKGADAVLSLHHLTYERLGHELIEDVRILCQRCHPYADMLRGRDATPSVPLRRDEEDVLMWIRKDFNESGDPLRDETEEFHERQRELRERRGW